MRLLLILRISLLLGRLELPEDFMRQLLLSERMRECPMHLDIINILGRRLGAVHVLVDRLRLQELGTHVLVLQRGVQVRLQLPPLRIARF
jgi:hypothetical protein